MPKIKAPRVPIKSAPTLSGRPNELANNIFYSIRESENAPSNSPVFNLIIKRAAESMEKDGTLPAEAKKSLDAWRTLEELSPGAG